MFEISCYEGVESGRKRLIGFEGADGVCECVVCEVVAISLLFRNSELRPDAFHREGSVTAGIMALVRANGAGVLG